MLAGSPAGVSAELHVCACVVAGLVYIFSTKSTYVFINFIDYSRYFSKPWGCFVCISMCVII